MSTDLFRFAAGSVLAMAAHVALAGAPMEGSPFLYSVSSGAESSWRQDVDAESSMEEVVVYGTAAAPHFESELIKAAIREQIRVLNEQLRDSFRIELEQLATPKLELASGARSAALPRA